MQFTQSLGIFMTLVYSSPRVLRTQGKIRNLSNIYGRLFSTEPCVTLVYSELETYSEPCQISMIENFIHDLVKPQHIQNRGIFRILPNIYQETFYSKPCVTLTYSEPLVHSELWYIQKSEHIQNPAKYLRLSILLTTCATIPDQEALYIQNFHIFRIGVSATP